MKTSYLDLSIGAPARLAILRRDFAQWFVKNPYAPPERVKSWRDVRRGNLTYPRGLSQGFNGEGRARVPVWVTHDGEAFRRELYARDSKEAPRSIANNRGYYTDPDQDETARSIIAYIGRGLWLAGYEWTGSGERVWFADTHGAEREACFAAAGHAECYAEREREYQERWRAAQALEFKIEEGMARLRECLALRNNPCFVALRAEARRCVKAIREARETLATDYAGVL